MTRAIPAAVGIITTIAGTALLAAPQRVGPLVGLTSRRDAVLVGVVDLALAPGLMFGRPRWPWLAARAAANPPTALLALRGARDGMQRRNARVFAAVLLVATVADVATVRALRR